MPAAWLADGLRISEMSHFSAFKGFAAMTRRRTGPAQLLDVDLIALLGARMGGS